MSMASISLNQKDTDYNIKTLKEGVSIEKPENLNKRAHSSSSRQLKSTMKIPLKTDYFNSTKFSIENFVQFPNYYGFFFREAYKNAFSSIKKSRIKHDITFNEENKIFFKFLNEKEDTSVPSLDMSLKKLHHQHVKQSLWK